MNATLGLTASGGVTLAAVLFSFWTGLQVGLMRPKFEVNAQATNGNQLFERAYRVQMNTLEQLVLFLPLLWLSTVFLKTWTWAPAAAGLVWIVGRILFATGYMADPAKRGRGFQIGMFANLALLILSIVGLVQTAMG